MQVGHEICQAAPATCDKTQAMEVNRVLSYRVDSHTCSDLENALNRESNLNRWN